MRVGDVFKTVSAGEITLLEIISRERVLISFEDGVTKEIPRKGLYDGKVKNQYQPSICGVGYLGVGIKPSYNSIQTPESNLWRGMIVRCYSSNTKQESYKKYSVCEEWHNFQNFAEWCYQVVGFGNKGWELDKDLMIPHNKVYSPDACVFLPKSINQAIGRYLEAPDFVGVKFKPKTGYYRVACYDKQKYKIMTRNFKNEDDAKSYYMSNRFNRLEVELNLYRELLCPKAVSRIEDIIKF